jgi:hypothetical protein
MTALLAGQLLPEVWGQGCASVVMKDALGLNHASLVDQVLEAKDAAHATALVTDFLVFSLLGKTINVPPEIAQAWRRIAKSAGGTSASELAYRSGWSHRHFNKQFQKSTGFDVKVASQLVRFSEANEAVTTTNTPPVGNRCKVWVLRLKPHEC